MSILSWNVQGMGNPWTVQHLRSLVKEFSPTIIFLMETRVHDSEITGFRYSFQQYNILIVSSVGRAGGLLLLWKKECDLTIKSYSQNHIDFIVKEDNNTIWRGTSIYGWPKQQEKYRTWTLLRSLRENQNQPWLCFGDFNEILYAFEKMGRRGCNISEMTAFLHTCTFCNPEDMSASGVKYTWTNGRRGEENVKKRLDRFLANPDWLELHPGASFQNLARIASDHSPIICRLVPLVKKKNRIFRFENMWLRDETIHEVVREAWASSLDNGLEHDPCAIVKECAVKLTLWNNTSFGHVQRSIKSKKRALEILQCRFDASTWCEQRDLREEIKELLTREEIMWKQRSRVQWLREGDRNTQFFHSRASNRRKQNNILRLKGEDGRWVENEEEVCSLVSRYFSDLFSSSSPQHCNSVVEDIDQSLTDGDRLSIERQVTSKEVYEALMQMAPNKAPGPDGMPALFFQKFWVFVGPTVVKMVTDFFETGVLPPNINKTLITLIPKVSQPESLKDLRPISLCNVLYKIISKVLVNRIKPILPRIIHENQSAFVSERVITDNAIVAFEVLHWLKKKEKWQKGSIST